MKILIIGLLLLSNMLFAETVMTIERSKVFAGEIISAKVTGYSGPELNNHKVDDNLYLVNLNESTANIIFLQKPSVNIAKNGDDVFRWNSIEVIPVEEASGIQLIAQNFGLKNNWLTYVLLIIGLIIFSGVYYWVRFLKPRKELKKKRLLIKEQLMNARNYDEVVIVWKNKHHFIETFSFIDEEFNKFEAVFYRYAFSPRINDEQKKEIEKSYSAFVSNVKGGDFGV